MRKIALFNHPDYLLHDTGPGHPERPDRLSHLMSYLRSAGVWDRVVHTVPHEASEEDIVRVHPESYVRSVRDRCEDGESILDGGDTHVCTESFRIARLAAGAVVEATDTVMKGGHQVSFCAVRPPGHHAETATAMGFCLFNNVAIGARYAQQVFGLDRVAILDWDVHHGNGTQEIFYEDPTVLYLSLHQYPFYPGTGAEGERGKGRGEGFTVNCPMQAGSTETEYLKAFETTILPSMKKFRPELVLISAGFDAHRDDPLAMINLSDQSFATFTSFVKDVAETSSNGRIVSVLEGGYDLDALAASVEAHLLVLSE